MNDWNVGLYRLLLRLYPRRFREQFGPEMVQIFRERSRGAGPARLWLEALADLAQSAPAQHLHEGLHAMQTQPLQTALRWLVALGSAAAAALLAVFGPPQQALAPVADWVARAALIAPWLVVALAAAGYLALRQQAGRGEHTICAVLLAAGGLAGLGGLLPSFVTALQIPAAVLLFAGLATLAMRYWKPQTLARSLSLQGVVLMGAAYTASNLLLSQQAVAGLLALNALALFAWGLSWAVLGWTALRDPAAPQALRA